MNVITFGTDAKAFEEHSDMRARLREYASLCDELHVIVLCRNGGFRSFVEGNLHVYPTNSRVIFWALIDGYKYAKKIITDKKFNRSEALISCQDPFEIGLLGLIVAKFFGCKLQLQLHTDFRNKFFIFESIKNFLRAIIATHILQFADNVRVVSKLLRTKMLAQKFHHVDAKKITILPIWVDVGQIKNLETSINLSALYPDFSFFIVVVSRLTREKNIGAAVKAIKKINKLHPEVALIVVGSGPEECVLRGFNFIEVVGWTDEPAQYIKAADIFLNTSNYEGYGRTLVEAAAAGTPIVTTDVGVARELVENKKTGFIVPVGDQAALETALLDVIEKRITLSTPSVEGISKQTYLEQYRAAWESCWG